MVFFLNTHHSISFLGFNSQFLEFFIFPFIKKGIMEKEKDKVCTDQTNAVHSVDIKKPVYQWFAKEKLSLSTSPGAEKLPPTPYGTPC